MARARLLHILPVVAAALWLGALAWAGTRINPWGPFGDGFRFYGLDVHAAVPWTCAILGAGCLVAAIVRDELAFPYAAVGFVALLAGGAKQLASTALVELLVLAVLLLCTLEMLTVRARFQGIVESGANLSREEQAPLATFMLRYAMSLTLTVGALAATLWALVGYVGPWLAGLFSPRLADSIELESTVGITLFVALPLLAAVVVRVLVDGLRPKAAAVEEHHDITDLPPIAREATP